MAEWGTYIDRQIRKAIEEGEFNNLPGEGKPLNLEENPNTPEELRMAYKVLRDNNLAPDWIMQGKALDVKINDLLEKLRRAVLRYQAALSASDASFSYREHAETAWRTTQAKLVGSSAKLNQEINFYNLKVPAGVVHKPLLNIQREISRLMESR
jgi:DnaJ family protein C protein 28